jgi:hypothetical protein
MLELRPLDHFGVALYGGFGEVTLEDSLDRDIDATVYELGGQLNWYPLEPFSSLVVGAEVSYVHIETELLPNSSSTVFAAGLGLGPLIGYKLISSGGFTFSAQGGVQYIALRAEERVGSETLDEDERARVVPLLNLNLGWSF